ncbi:MAG TPA: WecB/TagA/CpsF family glycosyltransferase [Candidatus Omnitrophota bacterium]|nr:WecB/TagA/CpsF family glycosyltransferase [Candidatus Omnitrophota bacterium]
MSQILDILGVRVSVTNLEQACQTIDGWISQRFKTYVCVAPVATVIESQDDEQFRQIINEAGMVTPDGMPLVWVGKWRGEKAIGRTYGPDLMLALCEKGQARGYRHFFYGGTQENNQRLAQQLRSQFPKINIVGHWAPPFRDKNEPEDAPILTMINNASADILWVGLGAPKQEYWMFHHRDKLDVPVMIGVGAAFDFIAGVKKQAPRWMQRAGLEWLFRLLSEPQRLWKRYIFGNTRFLYLSCLAWVKDKMQKEKP